MQTSYCMACKSPNRIAALFCQSCGSRLEQYCPECGASNRFNASFCQYCGYRLQARLLHQRYQIRQKLGQGGMGTVYYAEDTLLFNRRCVVKEMRTEHLSTSDKAEAKWNFTREAALLASLRHPAIPQIYEYFGADERYYLVMEYIEGKSLGDWVASAALPKAEVLRYGFQVCEILLYLATHQPPIVHRDVKPDNIILRGEQAILVDFGVAKPQTGRQDTSAWGTLGYAAPEQAAGRSQPKSDVYGLAATIYHLLTKDDPREHPFSFPALKTLSPAVEEILGQALMMSLEQRPTAQELKRVLSTLVTPERDSALRLLEAHTYGGIHRKSGKPKGGAIYRFSVTNSAVCVGLRLANKRPTHQHHHRLVVHFYSPDGKLYRVRQHSTPFEVAVGRKDVQMGIFGLYIAGTRVVNHLGSWRAVIYLDEQRLTELIFEIA